MKPMYNFHPQRLIRPEVRVNEMINFNHNSNNFQFTQMFDL